MPRGAHLHGSAEKSAYDSRTQKLLLEPDAGLAVILRNPAELAYAQFHQCKHDTWRRNPTFPRGDKRDAKEPGANLLKKKIDAGLATWIRYLASPPGRGNQTDSRSIPST
jgi:hypothetical protein